MTTATAHRMRIPQWVSLPFGYRVKVRTLCDTDFNAEGGEGALACWYSETMEVHLRSSRNLKQRRADLAHEMLHVVSDWQVQILGGKHADVRI